MAKKPKQKKTKPPKIIPKFPSEYLVGSHGGYCVFTDAMGVPYQFDLTTGVATAVTFI